MASVNDAVPSRSIDVVDVDSVSRMPALVSSRITEAPAAVVEVVARGATDVEVDVEVVDVVALEVVDATLVVVARVDPVVDGAAASCAVPPQPARATDAVIARART